MSGQEGFCQIKIGQNSTLQFSPLWASASQNHREKIRHQIENEAKINATHKTSVSHCPVLGGIFFSAQPCGLDIEVIDRVQEKTVARISSANEISQMKSFQLPPAFLWAAKEASWKATRSFDQPQTLSAMQIEFKQGAESRLDIEPSAQGIWTAYHAEIATDLAIAQQNEQRKSIRLKGYCWLYRHPNVIADLVISVCWAQRDSMND